MTDRGGWQRPGGGRPPWWPSDHSWPPRGEEWRSHGRRVARRLGCIAALAFLVVGAAGGALVWLLLSLLGAVTTAPLARILSGAGLLVGVLALVFGWSLLRRLAAPATRLVEAARRIEEGDYSARVPVRGPSDLRSVARAFNAMSGRLEAEDARRRSVLADVVHELRTPITVIRAQAEGIVDGVYAADAEQVRPVLAATRTLEVLVDDLRTLALAESGSLRLARETVDVAVLIDDAVTALGDVARAAGAIVQASVDPPGLTVDADPVRLGSVLRNVIANALRQLGAGGHVIVVAAKAGDDVVITVTDDGPGIDPSLLPRVFDRFVKGPESTGSGLGLAIVRDIIEAHGGTVSLSSTLGAGTTVSIRLPAEVSAP